MVRRRQIGQGGMKSYLCVFLKNLDDFWVPVPSIRFQFSIYGFFLFLDMSSEDNFFLFIQSKIVKLHFFTTQTPNTWILLILLPYNIKIVKPNLLNLVCELCFNFICKSEEKFPKFAKGHGIPKGHQMACVIVCSKAIRWGPYYWARL